MNTISTLDLETVMSSTISAAVATLERKNAFKSEAIGRVIANLEETLQECEEKDTTSGTSEEMALERMREIGRLKAGIKIAIITLTTYNQDSLYEI